MSVAREEHQHGQSRWCATIRHPLGGREWQLDHGNDTKRSLRRRSIGGNTTTTTTPAFTRGTRKTSSALALRSLSAHTAARTADLALPPPAPPPRAPTGDKDTPSSSSYPRHPRRRQHVRVQLHRRCHCARTSLHRRLERCIDPTSASQRAGLVHVRDHEVQQAIAKQRLQDPEDALPSPPASRVQAVGALRLPQNVPILEPALHHTGSTSVPCDPPTRKPFTKYRRSRHPI